jgi:hypothetical protein
MSGVRSKLQTCPDAHTLAVFLAHMIGRLLSSPERRPRNVLSTKRSSGCQEAFGETGDNIMSNITTRR